MGWLFHGVGRADSTRVSSIAMTVNASGGSPRSRKASASNVTTTVKQNFLLLKKELLARVFVGLMLIYTLNERGELRVWRASPA